MRRPRVGTHLLLGLALLLSGRGEVGAAQDLFLRTGAEASGWSRSTTHAEVLDFLNELQRHTDRMVVRELTVTNQGRSLPVVFLGDPPVVDPAGTMRSGKPTVLILASIHGNERSGKEGALQLLRELILGSEGELLEAMHLILVPHLNPDGGDNGTRTNSLGYDMNRDWIVAETPEISAVLEQLLLPFRPDLFVDVHNGGAMPYHLTYQATLDPDADPDLVAFARGPMYQAVRGALAAQGMGVHWYSGPGRSEAGEWIWQTTVPWPRKQHSYGGYQDMVTLLFEIPGGQGLEGGAAAAREGMRALLRFVAEEPDALQAVVREARRRTLEEPLQELSIELAAAPYPVREEFFVPREGTPASAREYDLVLAENWTLYEAVRSRPVPWGYLFDSRLDEVAAFLRRHGVQVEVLQESGVFPVERFRIEEISWASTPYQNHLMVEELDLEVLPARMELPAGTFLVRVRQPSGRLIPQLLEPDAVDSVVRWNFLDHSIPTRGGENAFIPIYRLMEGVALPTRLLP